MTRDDSGNDLFDAVATGRSVGPDTLCVCDQEFYLVCTVKHQHPVVSVVFDSDPLKGESSRSWVGLPHCSQRNSAQWYNSTGLAHLGHTCVLCTSVQ